MVAAWLGWRSWRQHTLRPLLTLGASLLLLNITVGAAKIGMGRLGPHYATTIGSNEMGLGGDIFPSGHTANAVVTWGILAYLASTPRGPPLAVRDLRGDLARASGMATVYLGTHWLSDVAARLGRGSADPARAALVRAADRPRRGLRSSTCATAGGPVARRPRRRSPRSRRPRPRSSPAPPRRTRPRPARPPRRRMSPGHRPIWPRARTRRRSERTPVTPVGSRRPPQADRVVRGTTSPAPAR